MQDLRELLMASLVWGGAPRPQSLALSGPGGRGRSSAAIVRGKARARFGASVKSFGARCCTEAMEVQEITAKTEPVLRKHDVSVAGLFGSRARGEECPASDVDLLAGLYPRKGLFAPIGPVTEDVNVLLKKFGPKV